MAGRDDERSGLIWSLGSWVAAIVGAIIVGWIVGKILGDAAGGIIFAGVTFIILGGLLTQYLGPPAADSAPHPAGGYGAVPAGHGHAAPAAPAPAPATAPVAAPAAAPIAPPVHTPPPTAPESGAISERVRDAARAAGEAARAALGDMEAATPAVEPSQPAMLAAPREGGADDLKRIKGVGPKLEEVLHGLGFYHFEQIAAWTPAELDWVDAHLEGFNGRATRDDWVGQSRILAAGGETEHSRRIDRGEST